jgi:hypothetical protein
VSNFLNYRYQEPLRGLTEPADARLFLEAVLDLLGSAGSDEGVPDVSRFNERMVPLYERLEPSARVAASRSIPTLMLMLSYPDRDIFVRSDVLHRARPALAGKKHAFDDEGMLTTTGYLEIRTFAEAIREKIAVLVPRDMIDVPGVPLVNANPTCPLVRQRQLQERHRPHRRHARKLPGAWRLRGRIRSRPFNPGAHSRSGQAEGRGTKEGCFAP